MSVSLWIRFSVMMLLQYWIWGAWGAYLPVYLGDELGFTGTQVGSIMSIFYVAFIFAPIIGGQITDRYMPSQIYLGISQLICGVLMFVLLYQTDFWSFLILMFIWSIFYAPTIPLTNAICFQNLDNVERDFGWIRIWGTLGWIFSGWVLTFWLININSAGSSCLLLSAFGSVALGLFSFALPHTQPKKEGGNPFAFLDALVMLKDPVFLIFMIISFVVATELMFYYVLTGPFLVDIGIEGDNIPFWMSFAQIGEILTLVILLPLLLPRIGIKNAILVGIVAWPIRYIIFAIGDPQWLIIASLPLHGVCYVFFFVVGQIYVDKAAPAHIRNSAQSLLAMVTFGFGLSIGGWFSGYIQDIFTVGSGGWVGQLVQGMLVTPDMEEGLILWTPVFLIPVVVTILCAIVFVFIFKEPKPSANKEPQASESAEA